MGDTNNNNSGGFAKTTDFKWLGIGLVIFILIAIMPTPDSMAQKAQDLFGNEPGIDIAEKALHIKLIIALLSTCVLFFATEAVPMPAVALLIGLVQLFFGITAPKMIAITYAHDAVWFIAGSLALGATLVKYGLDKRVGMLVINLAGTKTRNIVIGILLGTAIPTAFVGEHAVAAMYVPIALALFTLTNKSTPAPKLGTLLMVTIAVG
ncbi:MAG: SLC13 family permease, partial [Candidatus Neomarinimicrobiota bacterium]|nr:SLC13 family permease [Candidatus Neomarinimicrobiota bacterium]